MSDIEKAKEKFKEMVTVKKSIGGQIKYVVGWLERNYHFIFVEGNTDKTDELYVYEDGVYIPARRFIVNIIERITDTVKTNFINETVNKLGRKNSMLRKDFVKVEEPNLVCIENGILNLVTREISAFTYKRVFISKIPIVYDKNACCSKYLDFIEGVLCEEDVLTLFEWMGFCLWREYFKKKALVLLGPTNTGKTVVLNNLGYFVGEENKTSFEFEKLSVNNFAQASLYGKHLAINDEMSSKGLNDVSAFKKLTGKSPTCHEKKFCDQFDFFNYAKITAACNKMPVPIGTIEDPQSYYDRWLILNFEFIVSEEEQDCDLVEKISTGEELSGILNLALDGLDRLKKNGKFMNTKDWMVTRDIMESNGNSVVAFISGMLEKDIEGIVEKSKVYDEYKMFCKMKDLTCFGEKTYGKIFRGVCMYAVDYGSGKMQWKNVRIKGFNENYFMNMFD